MNPAELKTGGLFYRVDDFRIVARGKAGQLDFNAIVAPCTDNRLGDAHPIETVRHDVDRILQLLGLLELAHIGLRQLVDLQRDPDAALEVEPEAEAWLFAVFRICLSKILLRFF